MMTLHPIPAFSDNYIWCLHDGKTAYVVDPGEAGPVQSYLEQHALSLSGILITHHHWDHVSGIETLVAAFPNIPVWGPANETIPARTLSLSQNQTIELTFATDTVTFDVFDVPGHTAGHIAFYANQSPVGPLLFCGDTLFSAGCGRLFEGTAEQMFESLNQLKALPDNTKVCCTHEYTSANLSFALAVEPQNASIQEHIAQVNALRAKDQPSLPSSIGQEKRINPFLRAGETDVWETLAANCGQRPTSEVDSFAKLRAWKDSF